MRSSRAARACASKCAALAVRCRRLRTAFVAAFTPPPTRAGLRRPSSTGIPVSSSTRSGYTCLDKCRAVVEMGGELDADSPASAENIMSGLQAAFKNKGTQGVVLRINSPGGSPVQAGEINDEIRRLRAKYPATPIYAVVEEVCASGAYYVAVAADQIYVNKASLIGSIGVIIDGFRFVGAIDQVGIERRSLA